MAFRKQCDNQECGKTVGLDGVPFLQIHGSVSQQVEEGRNVEYRYLTPHAKAKMAYCDGQCFNAWVDQEAKNVDFIPRRQDIHREDLY